jgi:signal transduction histidine kinase
MSEERSLEVAAVSRWSIYAGALLLLIAGFATAIYEEHLYQDARTRAMHEQAEILAASVSAALSFGDRATIEQFIQQMQINTNLEAAGVYASNGSLVAGFVRKGRTKLPDRIFASQSWQERDRGVIVPVSEHHTSFGAVYLREGAEPPERWLPRYGILVLLGVMTAIVMASLGSAQARLRAQAERLERANRQLRDEMSERAKAEEALRQSQKMEAVGQLSGGIAHDLNNHLAIIRGNLGLLRRKLSLPQDDRHVAAMSEGVARAAALTQRILGFSRKQSLSPTIVDLNELVQSMDPLLRTTLRENVVVALNLTARHGVLIDRNQMENVLLNLAINARDAMPSGGKLFLATADVSAESPGAFAEGMAAGDYVSLEIRDTGVGMSDEVRAKAFDPFFTTKPVGQGTGLGLSTTYGFITQSGGHLTLESALEKGTTVTIYLPRAQAVQSGVHLERI